MMTWKMLCGSGAKNKAWKASGKYEYAIQRFKSRWALTYNAVTIPGFKTMKDAMDYVKTIEESEVKR